MYTTVCIESGLDALNQNLDEIVFAGRKVSDNYPNLTQHYKILTFLGGFDQGRIYMYVSIYVPGLIEDKTASPVYICFEIDSK